MYEVRLLNLKSGKEFSKVFYDEKQKDKFVKKCSYSKKVEVEGMLRYDW